ncbi:sigma-70 family RNA polymerase sigma factor [Roseibacterium sp. SDUM158017]|uniref:sigma-70 family RNA polymerase sigma factor n=1 Tax=Roseicyclus salinarum TaxID=3036773 RepID=UPI00241581BD|nr:sigma-70 family RNA polymerase sigma factor [Roseibacterium sp. SDUM158017]MDG4648658.1 sigma-70 family RNA polymerase sigma factor [Roseibacterium sp. SDUM158017]
MHELSFQAALKEPLLSLEEERAALVAWQRAGDSRALDRLVRSHARQAWAEARRWTDNPAHLEDLAAEGMIGLIQAADTFDLSMDVRFGTFSAWAVRNRVMAALGSVTAIIDVPTRAYIDARRGRLEAGGRADALAAIGRMVSIDDSDDEGSRPVSIAWDGLNPEEAASTRSSTEQVHRLLEEALSALDPLERDVIRQKLEDAPAPDDARRVPRARQLEIERRAMRRLRQTLQQRGFSFAMLEC